MVCERPSDDRWWANAVNWHFRIATSATKHRWLPSSPQKDSKWHRACQFRLRVMFGIGRRLLMMGSRLTRPAFWMDKSSTNSSTYHRLVTCSLPPHAIWCCCSCNWPTDATILSTRLWSSHPVSLAALANVLRPLLLAAIRRTMKMFVEFASIAEIESASNFSIFSFRLQRFLKICAEPRDSTEWSISVLSDKWIQRWSIGPNCVETFHFEDYEIVRKFKETFQQNIWPNRDVSEIETFLLDMQASGGNLYVLSAAINLKHTPQIYFAIFTLDDCESVFNIINFCEVKNSAFYSGDATDENLKYKLILNRSVAYVYGDRTIFEVILGGKNLIRSLGFWQTTLTLVFFPFPDIIHPSVENSERIEFPTQTDKLMAAVIYHQIPVFFTRLNGFVSISSSDFDNTDCFNK